VKHQQGVMQASPRVRNIPQIDSKANINNKIKPATPIISNYNNNVNNANNLKNQANKIPNFDNNNKNANNNNKKSPFFKEIAERELNKQKEIYEHEEKKEPPKKSPVNFNFNGLAAKNKEVFVNLKKNPPPPEPNEQGGIIVMPNFCEKKKPQKKKEVMEKKEVIEIHQKNMDPKVI